MIQRIESAEDPRLDPYRHVANPRWIREGIEQSQWDEARSFVAPVAEAIRKLTSEINRATSTLKEIVD